MSKTRCELCEYMIKVLMLYCALSFIPGFHAFAASLSGVKQKIDLVYDISWGNLRLAEATSQWLWVDDRAIVTGAVSSNGFLAMLSEFKSVSTAEIELKNKQWEPGFLSLSRVIKSKRVVSSVHWSRGGKILSDVQEPPLDLDDVYPIPDALKESVIDPYSAIMRQIDQIVATGRCGGGYSIYDGLRRFEIEFDSQGSTSLIADRPAAYSGHALVCGVITFPRGGHRIASSWHKKSIDDRRIMVYFGRFANDLILPVRIEMKTGFGMGIVRLDMDRSIIPNQFVQHTPHN